MAESKQALWWNRRAIGLHATLAVTVPGFLVLGWWQLHRALGGNGLSWAYTFEWPFFAGYAVYMWWKLVHEDAEPAVSSGNRPTRLSARRNLNATNSAHAASEDAALAAYNAHLEALGAADRRMTSVPEADGDPGPAPETD